MGKAVYSTVQRGEPENFDENVSHTKTRRRLEAFTRDVLVYVRTILNGVGQLELNGVGQLYMDWYDV